MHLGGCFEGCGFDVGGRKRNRSEGIGEGRTFIYLDPNLELEQDKRKRFLGSIMKLLVPKFVENFDCHYPKGHESLMRNYMIIRFNKAWRAVICDLYQLIKKYHRHDSITDMKNLMSPASVIASFSYSRLLNSNSLSADV
jgi:hypothetical protein